MAWCKEKNYIPKFDQFAWHDNYYKLLEDFSTYDNGVAAPQGPVTMTFPKDGDAFGSMAQLIEQGLEEDAVLEGKREKNLPKIVDEIEGALKKTNVVEESDKKKFSLKSNPNTEARIAELESKLVTSTSVPVYSNGDVTRYITKENGKYKLTDDPAKAIAVKPSEQSAVDAYVASQYKKNPLRMIGTEQVAKPAKLSYAEKNLINAEISALRNGFESVTDAKAYDQKRKTERLKADKASVEGSYFEQAARKGEPFYVEQGGEILCNYQSAVRTIVSEAKRMGAEEVYTSAKRGSKFGSSVYLKMNGVEVRISDHHLPQTMERSDINYNQRWDSELVLTNGKMIDIAAKIKTRDDMQEFLTALFATEADTAVQKNTTTESGGKKYSFKGINKHGIEVYETSAEVKTMRWKDRKKQFLDLMENEYKGRTAKFVRNGHAYYATFEKADVEKNIYGDSKSDDAGRDAKINAGADGDIFSIVENSVYDGSGVEKGKKIAAHTNVKYWDYFIKKVQIDGQVFDLLANVRKKPNNNYVYDITLVEDKKTEAAPPDGLHERRRSNGARTASEDMITQPEDSVNSQNSLKGEDEFRAELTRIREEGAKAGKTASEIQQDVNEFVERRRAENARAESTQRSRDAGGLQPHPERWTADRVGDTDKTPMSLSDIIAKIRHDFGINITTGHVRGTGVRGQYHLNNKGIRTRIAQDLPTVAHELGHALDDRYRITGGLAAELQTELIVKSHFL